MPEEFRPYVPRAVRIKKATLLLAVVAFVATGGAVAVWKMRRTPQPVPLPDVAKQIVDARSAAQYDVARQLVAKELKSHSSDPAIKGLWEDFQQDLQPDLRLHYLMQRALPSKSAGLNSGLQLTPDDEFYYTLDLVHAPRPCYAYLFLVDSSGDWTVLLPNKTYVPNANPLSPGRYQVPDAIHNKLRTPDTPGAEKLFEVAAYWRIDALEDLAAALAAETNTERARALGQQVLARLRLEDAAAAGIPGLAYGTDEFHNSGRPSAQEVEKH